MEVKKVKNKKIQDWIQIKKIHEDGIIELNNKKFIKIIKVNPINYNLKSDLEKKSILNSYKTFLKTCNFNIQILIQSSKENLEKNNINILNNIQKKENKYLKKIGEEYIKYLKNISITKKSSSKNYYIILSNNKINIKNEIQSNEMIKSDLKEKYFKIKECLSRCGNYVIEINNENEAIDIMYSFLNTRKNILKNNIKEEEKI